MASPLTQDPYQTLGVPKDATLAAIRSAHRKLVLQCHPDKVQDESLRAEKQDEFQRVHQAYETLSDERKRREYDERVRLAELRKEVFERAGGRTRGPYESPDGPSVSSYFEMRGGRVYEERVPNRSFEDDIGSSRHEQQRASARKYDGYEASSRRAREQDERRREKAAEDERERARAKFMKDTERSSHSDRRRTREKDRRRDYDDKYSRYSYSENATDSDSDDTEVLHTRRHSDSKRRHEDVRRYERVAPPTARRSSSRREAEDFHEWDYKLNHARDYIEKSKASGGPVEVDVRRPSAYRSTTRQSPYVESRSAQPPPPPPVESARRSSGRDRERDRERVRDRSRARSTGRERKGSTEIVEPMSRGYETRRPPAMPTSSSSPANLKSTLNGSSRTVPQPHRSATVQYEREVKLDMPSMLRRDSAPITASSSRRHESARIKSDLKISETHDSGYSSPGTPEMQYSGFTAQPRSTKYQIVDEEDDSRGHRTVLLEPDSSRRRPSLSPQSRRSPERPSLSMRGSSSSRHVPASRSTSYVPSSEATPSSRHVPTSSRSESNRAPPLSRMATSREPPAPRGSPGRGGALYGEVPKNGYDVPFEVQYSPKIKPEDVRFASYGRKGTESSSGRDAYPRSQYPESHRHAGMSRQESYAY